MEGYRQGTGCQAKAILQELNRYPPKAIRLSQPPLPCHGEEMRSALLWLAGEEGLERENPASWPNQE